MSELTKAVRQFRHNTDNTGTVDRPERGFVCAYDIEVVDKYVAALESQLTAERAAAERYRWLRNRLEIRSERSVAGDSRPHLNVIIGRGYLDRPLPPPGRGYEKLPEELDAAIDAALQATAQEASDA